MAEIKRRLRRFHRKYDGNKIIYNDESKKSNDSVNPVIKNDVVNFKESEILDLEHLEKDPNKKKEIIDKILYEMENTISPNIDAISEMIYNQLKKNNVEVDQDVIEDVVKRSDHYRAIKSYSDQTINSEKKVDVTLNRVDERKRLSEVIDNVYDQIKKKKIKDDIEIKKKEEEKEKIVSEIKTKEKEQVETKKEDLKEKKSLENDTKKSEDNNNLNLNFEDDNSKLDNEDDLGLKF